MPVAERLLIGRRGDGCWRYNRMCKCVVACGWGYFRCVAGGSCLYLFLRCDGRCDCAYCTDELNCYTPSYPNITTIQPSVTTTSQPLFNHSKLAAVSHWFTVHLNFGWDTWIFCHYRRAQITRLFISYFRLAIQHENVCTIKCTLCVKIKHLHSLFVITLTNMDRF